jgi:hypothetical protein
MYYNFVRIHQTLKVMPAMAAGVNHAVRCEPMFPGLRDSGAVDGVSAVQIPGVPSLAQAEVVIASILAPGLWALQSRS